MNKFLYSNDNKRYHTFNYETRKHYGFKVFKVGLNAGFTCPNRDGKVAFGGCSFCNEIGSGDFQGNTTLNLLEQFDRGVAIQRKKWPDAKAIAYFQAFTNTYAPLERPVLGGDDVLPAHVHAPALVESHLRAVGVTGRADFHHLREGDVGGSPARRLPH